MRIRGVREDERSTFQLLKVTRENAAVFGDRDGLLKMHRKDIICTLSHDVFEHIVGSGGFALVEFVFTTEDVPVGTQQQAEASVVPVTKEEWFDLRNELER